MDKYEEKYLKYKYKYINLVHANDKVGSGKAANKALLLAMPNTVSHKYTNLAHLNNKVRGGKVPNNTSQKAIPAGYPVKIAI